LEELYRCFWRDWKNKKNLHYMKNIKPRGFILIFTLLIASVLLITAGQIYMFVYGQTSVIRNEMHSSMALYASDAGIECVRFYQAHYGAFNTNSPKRTIDCGVGTASVGSVSPPPQCIDGTYDFRLSGFDNGACTDVHVDVTAETVIVGGNPQVICTLFVVSSGKNTCSAGGRGVVERARWESM
jgi:hypothetical protein